MLWIVGKVFSSFRNYLSEQNVPYGVFWDKNVSLPENMQARVQLVDFSDSSALEQQVRHISRSDVSAVVVAGYENYVLPAAYLARYFNVKGPSVTAATAATDKAVMRQSFIDYDPALSPSFASISSWQEIADFMVTHSFPVMLKPASLMKSLLITKNGSLAELRQNYTYMTREIERLYAKYSVTQKPKVIIEEFLEGSMHTIAAFVDADGNPILLPGIVDLVTGQERGFNDNFLYSRSLPSTLPIQQQEALQDIARRGMAALGLTSCPAHVELILTKNGPKIIEIGARIGGYRPRMYAYGYGLDVEKLMIRNALAQPLEIAVNAQCSVAIFELFPEMEGQFDHVSFEQEITKLPSLRHLSIKPTSGDTIGRSSQGYKAAAVIILSNEDQAQFERDVEFVQDNAHITLVS